MRSVILLSLASAIIACSASPPPATMSPVAQNRLDKLIAGKVAGPPETCLANYRTTNMVAIDEYTVAFRDGGRRVYVNKLQGACSRLGSPRYALITRQSGHPSLCRGDIAEVADVQAGISVGNCALGDFIPYTKP